MAKKVIVWVQKFKDRPCLMLRWHDPLTGKCKSRSALTGDQAQAEEKRKQLERELNEQSGGRPARNQGDELVFLEGWMRGYAAGYSLRSKPSNDEVLYLFRELFSRKGLIGANSA